MDNLKNKYQCIILKLCTPNFTQTIALIDEYSMKIILFFFFTIPNILCMSIGATSPWYPAFKKLSGSDFSVLENSYAVLKADPLENPSKHRRDILLLILSYAHHKDFSNFKKTLQFFFL
ncbi:hypothetical protein MJH12_08925, partial [bacterium]|nr:hypothetical protein [bacterium]